MVVVPLALPFAALRTLAERGPTVSSRKLTVSRHAVAAYSRRCTDQKALRLLTDVGWSLDDVQRVYGHEEAQQLINVYNELEREIVECVTYALENGLTLNHKPKGFRLYRSKNTNLPSGQRFVRCDESSSFGFIVKRDPSGEDVVMTTLSRAGVWK